MATAVVVHAAAAAASAVKAPHYFSAPLAKQLYQGKQESYLALDQANLSLDLYRHTDTNPQLSMVPSIDTVQNGAPYTNGHAAASTSLATSNRLQGKVAIVTGEETLHLLKLQTRII